MPISRLDALVLSLAEQEAEPLIEESEIVQILEESAQGLDHETLVDDADEWVQIVREVTSVQKSD